MKKTIPHTGFSLMLKSFVTGFLILVMLIPAMFVLNLVEERQDRQQEVIKEVSSKWASSQVLSGPWLMIPYSYPEKVSDKETITVVKYLTLLPESLETRASVAPLLKKRGIYKVALYQSDINLKGHFNLADIKPGASETIAWNEARLCLGLTDTRGIETQLSGKLGIGDLAFEAGLPDNPVAQSGASVPVDLSAADRSQPLSFQLPVSLKGSETLQITPLGKTTKVNMQSSWPSPSFTGKFLPSHQPSGEGFTADWQVLHFNRDFPQVWKDKKFDAEAYAFGVSLLQPTDNYAKTMRTAKYAILFIGLTFGFFFLLEALQGRRVHPIQYILVGIALIVFYTLLLSIGEVIAFDMAYLLASTATIGLITLYGKHLFELWKNALYLGGFLAGLYGFIFMLIQLEDSALIVGSIGLFLLVALAMYLSRKVEWYGPRTSEE